jgi:hypothetical protein
VKASLPQHLRRNIRVIAAIYAPEPEAIFVALKKLDALLQFLDGPL